MVWWLLHFFSEGPTFSHRIASGFTQCSFRHVKLLAHLCNQGYVWKRLYTVKCAIFKCFSYSKYWLSLVCVRMHRHRCRLTRILYTHAQTNKWTNGTPQHLFTFKVYGTMKHATTSNLSAVAREDSCCEQVGVRLTLKDWQDSLTTPTQWCKL